MGISCRMYLLDQDDTLYRLPSAKFSVKETRVETNAVLPDEGHGDIASGDQALAGVMKPNLVRALIQRGALR